MIAGLWLMVMALVFSVLPPLQAVSVCVLATVIALPHLLRWMRRP